MSRLLLMSVLTLFILFAVAAEPPTSPKEGIGEGLKVGADLPGPFHPYNITGPHRGQFHSLVSDYDMDPVVVLFVHSFEATDTLKDLLKQLDERIDKNPAARLHAFVVFFSEEFPDVLTNNDKREEVAKKLEELANSLAFKNVLFCLGSPADVAKYALGDAPATALLYNKYRVVAIHTLSEADAKAASDKVLADVAEKLKAKKTK